MRPSLWLLAFGAVLVLVMPRVDLDRDGTPETIEVRDGAVSVEEDGELRWQSPPAWRVDGFTVGDLTHSGRPVLAISVWKAGNYGSSLPFWVEENDALVKQHLFVYELRDDAITPVWQSSNLEAPNCSIEAVPGAEGSDLRVFEGTYDDGCEVTREALWSWNGWGFTNIWRK